MAGRRRRGASAGGCRGGSPDTWDGTWEGKILETIYGHYKEALDALPLQDMPALASRLLDAGVCFGFADPVTNIIANTLSFLPEEIGDPTPVEPEASAAKMSKRKRKRKVREEVLSKIVASDGPSPPETRTLAERSLEGLVRFLTSYFRHLSTLDALRYLCLARADLLIAVHLIQDDRCYLRSEELRINSLAADMALKCAAFSARQPNVDGFLSVCSTVVSRMNLITQILSAGRCLTTQDISLLSGLIQKPRRHKRSDKRKPMDLATQRFHHQEINGCIEHVSGVLTESLQSVLMDKIHHHYLKAVSRFPLKEFQNRLHLSLLKSGYCYGPFDPESNILVNVIWYDTVFPPSEGFEVDMISTLRHVESRSLNGLIAFVCACFPEISKHKAMVYLLKNKLNISKVIRMAELDGYNASAREDIGYKAAANAASHPNPEEYFEFAVHHLSTVRSSVMSLLHASHVLSSSGILELSNLLSFPSVESVEPTVVLTEDALKMIGNYKENFISQQSFVRAKVEAALQHYKQTKGHHYELGIICGVNYNVGKERRIMDSKCHYSHVNFWASSDDGTSTTLFFAQFSNYGDNDNYQSFCYPILDISAKVRCCYCECEGIRIVHPIEACWEGARGFEEISCGDHTITNEEIISRGKLIDNQVMGIFDQDCLYLDPVWDKKLIEAVNHTAWTMNLDINDEMRRIKAKGGAD